MSPKSRITRVGKNNVATKPPPTLEPIPLEAEAQKVLDGLWKEDLIPFELNVGKITKDQDEYTIHFYDSRIRSTPIPTTGSDSFSESVRKAVLERVARMSGPLPPKFIKG